MIADIFMLKESEVFTCSDLISSIFSPVVTSSSDFPDSIFLPTLLLTVILSENYSNRLLIEYIYFSCSMNFDENLLFSSLSTLVSSERRSVSDLILASSFTILFYH